jgi:hypothetical protein
MHSGFDSGNGFGSGFNIKWNQKVKNSKMRVQLSGNNAACNIEKVRNCTNFVIVEKLCQILSGSGTGIETFLKSEQEK